MQNIVMRIFNKWCKSLEKVFSPNSSYIILLDVNFENLTIGLHVLMISSMLVDCRILNGKGT